MSESLVVVEKLCHSFGEGESRRQVLFDNDFLLNPAEIAILTGPSGSGKTTLLTLIGGLRSVQQGRAQVFGRELKDLDANGLVQIRRNIGFIFQHHNLFEALTVLENVMVAAQLNAEASSEMEPKAKKLLERLGLGLHLHSKPRDISGGQRQRVAIARALVNAPSLILADEPTAALDKDASRDVIDLFRELSKEQRCGIIIVTHDSRVLDAADRIINMVDGRIISDVLARESLHVCEFLMKCPAFAALSPIVLTDIADKMRRQRVPPGATIMRRGDRGNNFYIIRSGAVGLYRDVAGAMELGTTLKEGEFFGEAALSGGSPDVTVIAATETDLYVLDHSDFEAAIEATTNFNEIMKRALFNRQ
jgi:putative ABC transport system ATP-binding protein